nr:hypothetical protein GCM10020093_097440 [Planobispora longispora]
MDALIKLAGQIGAAGVLAAFDVTLPWIPLPSDMGGVQSLDSMLRALITILIVVVMINAVNFVDGLDGLAAGIVGIAAMATWTYAIFLSTDFGNTSINATATIAAVLIGMCLGFLPHNFHPAKIFMGDTGAMLIGLVLASTMITITPLDSNSINTFPVILPLLLPVAILVLPLLDLIMAVIRRTSNGLSPFAPDRGHLHHRLLDIGHSHRRSVLIMYAWTFLFAFAVVAMSYEGVPLALFLLTVLLAVGVLVAMALPRLRSRRNGGARTPPDVTRVRRRNPSGGRTPALSPLKPPSPPGLRSPPAPRPRRAPARSSRSRPRRAPARSSRSRRRRARPRRFPARSPWSPRSRRSFRRSRRGRRTRGRPRRATTRRCCPSSPTCRSALPGRAFRPLRRRAEHVPETS